MTQDRELNKAIYVARSCGVGENYIQKAVSICNDPAYGPRRRKIAIELLASASRAPAPLRGMPGKQSFARAYQEGKIERVQRPPTEPGGMGTSFRYGGRY